MEFKMSVFEEELQDFWNRVGVICLLQSYKEQMIKMNDKYNFDEADKVKISALYDSFMTILMHVDSSARIIDFHKQ